MLLPPHVPPSYFRLLSPLPAREGTKVGFRFGCMPPKDTRLPSGPNDDTDFFEVNMLENYCGQLLLSQIATLT